MQQNRDRYCVDTLSSGVNMVRTRFTGTGTVVSVVTRMNTCRIVAPRLIPGVLCSAAEVKDGSNQKAMLWN